jgi:hypothetical protein
MPVGLQHSLHLEKSDPDARRLSMREGFGADEENAAHARPFILSTICPDRGGP